MRNTTVNLTCLSVCFFYDTDAECRDSKYVISELVATCTRSLAYGRFFPIF